MHRFGDKIVMGNVTMYDVTILNHEDNNAKWPNTDKQHSLYIYIQDFIFVGLGLYIFMKITLNIEL